VDAEISFRELLDDTLSYLKTGFKDSDSVLRNLRTNHVERGTGKSNYDSGFDEQIGRCTKCRLHLRRKNAVPGEGNKVADIMFIGEGPGEQEDIQGRPFVGRAGELLTRMLAAIGLTREGVYITNIVKCRPPGNRNPQPDEVDSCYPYLARQIAMIEPLIIVCLGGPAVKTIIKSELGITKLRGTFHRYGVIPVLATYHPAAVLRFPEKYKRDVWNDLKLLRDFYGDLRT
jgi:DNA polymerase